MNPLWDQAPERLFERYAESLFAFFVYRTGNRTVAEDLVADTFERALRSRGRFDPRRGSQKTWIYTIAINLLRDQARRQTIERRSLELVGSERSGHSDDAAIGAVDERDALGRALETLSDEERETIALRFTSDLRVRDVARVVGASEDAVEKRLQRALLKLRLELKEPE